MKTTKAGKNKPTDCHEFCAYWGKNIEGDMVKIEKHRSGHYPISYRNVKEGYAGATVIPKEFIEQLLRQAEAEAVKRFVERVKKEIGDIRMKLLSKIPHVQNAHSDDFVEEIGERIELVNGFRSHLIEALNQTYHELYPEGKEEGK